MPGLQLGVGANVRTGAQPSYTSSPAPTTATEAAFGPGASMAPAVAGLAPNTPAGLAVWVGIGGLVLLVAVYFSLPG